MKEIKSKMNSNTNILDIISLAKKSGVTFLLEEDKVRLKVEKGRAIDKQLLADLKEHKSEIKDFLLNEHQQLIVEGKSIQIVDRDALMLLPLSFAQERLWFVDKISGSVQYHMPAVLRLSGKLDSETLEESLRDVIQRHEVLRTVLKEQDGEAFQEVRPADAWSMSYEQEADLQTEASLQDHLQAVVNKPFDLSADYMLRAQLIKLKEDEHILLLVIHHIAADGWSVSLFLNELLESYRSKVEARKANLPELPIQYLDYALWQREQLKGALLEQKLEYWKEKLTGLSTLDIPTDYVRPKEQSTKGRVLSTKLNNVFTAALKQLAQEQGVTLFMLLLSAFKVLLQRYSGQADICVGTPIAGRTRQETEGLIGFFVNMLALRTQINDELRFDDLLNELKTTTLEAFEHQDVPFSQVVEATTSGRDLSRNPLFDITFSLNTDGTVEGTGNYFDTAIQMSEGLSVQLQNIEEKNTAFDLALDIEEQNGELLLSTQYCTDLYKEETIAQLLKHYEVLLESIVANPSVLVSDLNLISASERSILLGHEPTESGVWFNKGAVDLGNTETIEERFVRMVEQYGEEVAVIHGDNHWTFNQLEEYSNQVANELLSRGLNKQDLVGVYLDRSPELIGSLLGILKAGGVYVPLDRQNPMDRLEKMLEDGNFAHVISQQEQWKDLEDLEYDRVLYLESIEASTERPKIKNELRDWAYMLYTSGSTGAPKGAITRHDGAMNHILAEYALLDLSDGFRFLQSAGIGSDISLFQMLAPILKGGASVIIDRYDVLDYETLIATIEENEVSLVEFVPSYIRGLIDRIKERGLVPAFKALKGIMMVGEAVPVELVNEWRKLYPETRVVNGYGPCEASDDITQYEIKSELDERLARVPIGEPLQNLNIFICDEKGELKPNRRSRRDLCEWRRCRSRILGTGREDSRTLCSQSF